VQRDGERCAFVDEKGRRCSATAMLEFHHIDPYGRGGPHTADNVQLVCSAHNRYLAQHAYGAARIAQRIAAARPRSSLPDEARAVSQQGPGASRAGGPCSLPPVPLDAPGSPSAPRSQGASRAGGPCSADSHFSAPAASPQMKRRSSCPP
jgi:hypothetical protein